jgi:hypothetical protein
MVGFTVLGAGIFWSRNLQTHRPFANERYGMGRGEGAHTVAAELKEGSYKGFHRVEVLDRKGNPSEAILELKHHRMRVIPPIGKQG